MFDLTRKSDTSPLFEIALVLARVAVLNRSRVRARVAVVPKSRQACARAACMALRRRGLPFGSPPPVLAAMVISLDNLLKIFCNSRVQRNVFQDDKRARGATQNLGYAPLNRAGEGRVELRDCLI